MSDLALNSVRAAWRLAFFLAAIFGFSASLEASERWTGLAAGIFHGLSGPGVPSGAKVIVEDGDGFLWIGTESGMVRWDGYHFRTYTVVPDIPVTVRTMHIDSRGNLWVGTQYGGLLRYVRQQDRFVAYPTRSTYLKNGYILSIADDGSGGLWIGTNEGLEHLIDPDSERFARPDRNSALPEALSNERINAVLRDRAGSVWVGGKGGLARLQKGSSGFVQVRFPHAGSKQIEVSYLFEDSAGRLWVGTVRDGTFVMAPQSDHAASVDERIPAGIVTGKDWVVCIEEPYPGEIWLGTTDGIVVVHAASGESRRIRRESLLNTSLPSDTVETMYKDRSGLLWLGTPQGIAWRNMQSAALTLFGGFGRVALDSGDVYAVLQAEDRSVWLGLARGIQIIDATATKSRRLAAKPGIAAAELANAFVFTLAAGQSDQVYVGTQRGLFQVDGRSQRVSTVPIAANDKAPIVTALFAEKDHLWIGSDNGELWRLDFANSRVEKILGRDDKGRSSSSGIVAIQRGPDGSLWVLAPGLNRVDPITRTIEHVPVDSLNPNAMVTTFFTDSKGRLWFSSGDGVSRLEGRDAQGRFRFRHIGVKDGLPDANIDKILEVPDGHIWVSTDDGIAVIDPETFGIRVLHEADDVAIISYWRGSGSVTRDGELLFGGVGGLTILHPDRLTDWSFRPSVVISGIKIDGMPAAVDRPNDVAASLAPLVIQPEATSFSVEFSALDFSAPERNRYSYRLEGYDRTWIDTDADHRIAAYTNLAPGDYVLRMRGSNRNGVWTEPALALPVHVVAAWYQTWWFKLAVGLAAVLAVYALVQRRTAYLLRRQREIEGLIEERTNDLRESRNQLEQLAYHDSLTGLPNRRMFSDQFIHSVAIAERQRSRFALLLVDLDKFKEINDTLGHDAGDALLVAVAKLLQSATRKSDHVFRLGGDEFAVLLMPDHQSLDIETVCRRIIEAFIPKIVFADKIMSTSPSIGVAMFPDHGRTQDGLYKAADLALYQAKCAGRNTWRLASDQTSAD